jgi:hypothetical protein
VSPSLTSAMVGSARAGLLCTLTRVEIGKGDWAEYLASVMTLADVSQHYPSRRKS